MDTGVQEAIPVLSALFGGPEDLETGRVFLVELLSYQLPVNLGIVFDEVSKYF